MGWWRIFRTALAPWRRRVEHARNRNRTAEQVFTAVYHQGKWGRESDRFDSGAGSADNAATVAYLDLIRKEAVARGFEGKRWLDLGCGDFRIGGRLRELAGSYTAVDVVLPLIEYHRGHWMGPPVDFLHLDVTSGEPLPEADVVFVRQVLQHLSNRQIQQVLNRLRNYPLVYITEHVPSGGRMKIANLDMAHGSGIRLYRDSGVDLTAPPFQVPADQLRKLLEVPVVFPGSPGDHGVLETWCYTPGGLAADR